MTDSPASELPYRPRARPDKVTLAVVVLLVLVLGGIGSTLYLTLTRTAADCAVWHDLGSVPVTIARGASRPSQLSTSIIADARAAFRGSGCAGTLPPPTALFVKWAPYYHLSPR